MYLKQFVRDESGCASYLIGSLREGCCAVIDPQWAVEPYLQAAAAKGLRITEVLETHLHADHLSAPGAWPRRPGAEIGLHTAADVAYPHRALADGDVVRLGEVELRVLHTPGHRPEKSPTWSPTASGRRSRARCSRATRYSSAGSAARTWAGGAAYAAHLYASLFDKLLRCPTSSTSIRRTSAARRAARAERRDQLDHRLRAPLQLGGTPRCVSSSSTWSRASYRRSRATSRRSCEEPRALPVVEPQASPLAPERAQRLAAGAIPLDARDVRAFGAVHLPAL